MRRASLTLCTASAWASFLLSSAAAHAADPPSAQARVELAPQPTTVGKAAATPQPAPPAASPDASAPTDPTRAGEAAYQRALAIYATGDIKGAFDSMQESYRLSQRPELLYNLARLERELEECQASLEDYRRYLQRVPNGRYRSAAEQACVELERVCPAADPAPIVAPPQSTPTSDAIAPAEEAHKPPSANPSYWTTQRTLGWSAIATGAVAGGVALYFRQAAVAARDDYGASIALQTSGKGPRNDSLQAKQRRDSTAAEVLGVTGGALVTAGALLLILGPRAADPASSDAALYFPPGGIGACFSRRF